MLLVLCRALWLLAAFLCVVSCLMPSGCVYWALGSPWHCDHLFEEEGAGPEVI